MRHFLAEVHDLFPTAVGADIDLNQTLDCRTRFADVSGLSFVLTNDLCGAAHAGAYQVVTCMEVLEHCVDGRIATSCCSTSGGYYLPTGSWS